MIDEIKQFVKDNQQNIVLISGIILIALISFGAGRMTCFNFTNYESKQITTNNNFQTETQEKTEIIGEETEEGMPVTYRFVASKKGAAYHYPWCPGAKAIKEENKIWFNSEEEAEKAGYRPAGNCPGLQPH